MKKSILYLSLKNNPPINGFGTRRMGCRAFECFWKGYDNLNPPARNTLAHQAWRAGRDYRKGQKS